MLENFIVLADLVIELGGHVSFEWPRYCSGWLLPILISFIERRQLYIVDVDAK